MYETKEIIPSDPLVKKYVHSFWFLKSDMIDEPYLLPPDFCLNCILSLGNDTNLSRSDGVISKIKGSFMTGILKSHVFLKPFGGIEYIAIRFRSYGVRPLVRFSCSEFTDLFVEMDDAGEKLASLVNSAIDSDMAFEERVSVIEASLRYYFSRSESVPSRELVNAFNMIERSSGSISISDLCDQSGITSRQLNRDFERFVGVSPKYYSRIVRFNHLVTVLKGLPSDFDLASLALDLGYYDQSHMNHECSLFSGKTPLELQYLCR